MVRPPRTGLDGLDEHADPPPDPLAARVVEQLRLAARPRLSDAMTRLGAVDRHAEQGAAAAPAPGGAPAPSTWRTLAAARDRSWGQPAQRAANTPGLKVASSVSDRAATSRAGVGSGR